MTNIYEGQMDIVIKMNLRESGLIIEELAQIYRSRPFKKGWLIKMLLHAARRADTMVRKHVEKYDMFGNEKHNQQAEGARA